MKLTLDWQKRAIILFAVIVLIFSVILMVFAIREAERDKLEKLEEINQEQRQIADTINAQVFAYIRETEAQALRLISMVNDPEDGNQVVEASNKIKESEKLVDIIFYVDRSGQINFPLLKLLYVLNGESEFLNRNPLEIENNQLFRSAETAEYQRRYYSQAITDYRQLLRSTSHKESRALLLNRIARGYMAAGNTERAIQTYKSIVKDFDEILSPEGIPYALIALNQLGALYSGRDENLANVGTNLDLYAALLEPNWQLTQVQFFYYLRKVKKELESIKQNVEVNDLDGKIADRWRELEQTEQEKLGSMANVETIASRIRSVLMTKETALENSSGAFFHILEKLKNKYLPISYTLPDGQSVFGFSLNISFLEDEILSSILNNTEPGEEFNIQVVDAENDRLIAGETSWADDSRFQRSHTQGFKENFLPWELRIYQALPNIAERQFRMRRNIYVLSVLVVITAILLGGLLTIRSTGKELRLAKLKSEFVSTVSHEFRTPLMSIRYLADLLQRGRVKDETKKQQYYESITHESERLSRLVENILDFSKIEAGMKEYEFTETDVAEMCQDVISRFQEQVGSLEFRVESDVSPDLPRITADKEALSRALFNLLDNSVKYSGNNRTIKFQAWTDQESVLLKVEDQGIGIKKEDQERIFEKFFRSGEIQDSSIKGSGIGLTLVSHIVKAHGGEVNLESEIGEGTEITIQLPIVNKKG